MGEAEFVTTGVYSLVRHPTYSFLFLGYFITPKINVTHAYMTFPCPTFVDEGMKRVWCVEASSPVLFL